MVHDSPTPGPTTPVRPPRSLRRLTLEAPLSAAFISECSEDTYSTPPPPPPPLPSSGCSSLDDAPHEAEPTTPSTPKTPTRARIANRKSTASIRRKPVPLTAEDLTLELGGAVHDEPLPVTPSVSRPITPGVPLSAAEHDSSLALSSSFSAEPPRYILPVDPPFASTSRVPPSQERYDTSIDFSASRPPSYAGDHDARPSPSYAGRPSQDPFADLSGGLGGNLAGASTSQAHMMEDLPSYAKETETEPKTLARALWRWGFLCPFLWFIGMCIMWIPLKPIEEERDAEKAQTLEEMIVILRETELKYAKKCMWGFIAFAVLLTVTIVIGIVVSMRT
ncbi:hypothetical protein IAU59_002419 [Kwoniella sp. CBS 9459]